MYNMYSDFTIMKIRTYVYMKEYASDQSRILLAELSEMNRREIK